MAAPVSSDWERLFDVAGSTLVGSTFEVEDAQCCDRMDRDSSIGVNMLRDCFELRFFGGSSIC